MELLEQIDIDIDSIMNDNENIKKFKKMFVVLDIQIPTNVKKKLDSRESKNNNALSELMRKRERVSRETKAKIENNI